MQVVGNTLDNPSTPYELAVAYINTAAVGTYDLRLADPLIATVGLTLSHAFATS